MTAKITPFQAGFEAGVKEGCRQRSLETVLYGLFSYWSWREWGTYVSATIAAVAITMLLIVLAGVFIRWEARPCAGEVFYCDQVGNCNSRDK